MEIPCVLTMCQIIFWSCVHIDSARIPGIVSFNILSKLDGEINVNLIPAETFLANENLRVWVPQRGKLKNLRLVKYVVKNLTPFSVYRDSQTCAAAVYFHKRRQFEGTIGHHHIIRGLQYDLKTKKVESIENTVLISPLENHGNRLAEEKPSYVHEVGQSRTSGIRSLAKYPDTIYVETLVMVHHDITEHFKHDSTATVTYVLTLFNSVDMLFSTINKPNIRINIAGIIIGTSVLSFPEFIRKSCYERDSNKFQRFEIETVCGYHAIKKTLHNYRNFPHQSYDIVIFLTRYDLMGYESIHSENGDHLKKIYAYGRAFSPSNINGYRQSLEEKGVAIVSDTESLKYFPTVAHEIAHLLGVPHDGGPLWEEDGTCTAHIMKKDKSFCNKCLKFGGTTPNHLEIFFGSRDGCSFRNEPHSLNEPSVPKLFWNSEEQCQCYGYPATYSPKYCSTLRDIFSSTKNCDSFLRCVDEHNRVHVTTYYMNGTPCDRGEIGNKICWNYACKAIELDDVREQHIRVK